MSLPWLDLAAGNAPPPYRPQPAASATYGAPPSPKVVYLRPDRHGLRTWSSPDPAKLNAFVQEVDALDAEAARTFVDSLPRTNDRRTSPDGP